MAANGPTILNAQFNGRTREAFCWLSSANLPIMLPSYPSRDTTREYGQKPCEHIDRHVIPSP